MGAEMYGSGSTSTGLKADLLSCAAAHRREARRLEKYYPDTEDELIRQSIRKHRLEAERLEREAADLG